MPAPSAYEEELQVAIAAARIAGCIQNRHFRSALGIERKPDRSPVTAVDRACEDRIREHLLTRFPADGFLGEESEAHSGTGGRRWIVDPLDGTRPYLRGIPTFSVLLALESEGELVVGVIFLPALNELCWARRGGGAFLNHQRIHVSGVDALAGAMGSAMGLVERAHAPDGQRLMALMRRLDYAYGFMDAYSYVALASGKLDLCISLLDQPWDCAAAACIVREAGGRFSDLQGQNSVHNGSAVATNGTLHPAVLDALMPAP